MAAVKLSVESVVESLVLRYETHFQKARQLTEDHALEEMEISENGPILVKADGVLKAAMNRYWKTNSDDRKWHFIRTSKYIKCYQGNQGKTVSNLLQEKSKFPFQDK